MNRIPACLTTENQCLKRIPACLTTENQCLKWSESTRIPGICGGETFCLCEDNLAGHVGHTCIYLSMTCCMLSKMDEIELVGKTSTEDLLLLVGRIISSKGREVLARRLEKDI